MANCLGILRELQNSPNRESDDALILKAVMEQLEIIKVKTALLTPEEADRADLSGWDMIVPMCESYPRLMRLKSAAGKNVIMVNPPQSVLNCYRTNMIEAFKAYPEINLPPTEVRRASGAGRTAPAFGWEGGVWLKRGDVHNTCSHDVVYARDGAEAEAVCRDFASREISHVLLQKHVDGDLIKFYGVGPGRWFTWFYHDPQSARRLQFELDDLAAMAAAGAKALDLEIFGGDAIVTPQGAIFLIDINSWPSFARVRTEAAVQIAWQLRTRLRRRKTSKRRQE
jgi:glutathione synthase/RimK-type ligase-like ATP-grasp enzyme